MAETRLRELLRHFEERGIAAEYCQYVLGRLVAYDRAHNADLLKTLRVKEGLTTYAEGGTMPPPSA